MQLTNPQTQTLQHLGIYDQVQDIISHNLEISKPKILELIAKTKVDIQQKIFKIVHSSEFLNPYKLTTIDPIELQKNLDTMVKNGCKVAVIEISSQGLEQNRHWGLGKLSK